MRHPPPRGSDWTEELAALVELVRRDPDVRALVAAVGRRPEAFWSWPNRALPVRALQAAGSLGELLVVRDPIVQQTFHHFRKTTYTYWPAPFLLDNLGELRSALAEAEGRRAASR
jgi:hypothetical protein